jgi:serine/threonine protein kinase
MVSKDEICKVGDFGLLRELPKDDTTIYVSQTAVALPTRWMAPESLTKREFSPASDMWSFGVVMWEMCNPTELPYKDKNNMEVTVGVNQDLRLPIPDVYPPTVKKIMKACWQLSPSKRPSFLLIASLLTNVYFGAE